MKFFVSFILVALLGAGGYFFWKLAPTQEAGSHGAAHTTTAPVEVRDIRFVVNAAGDVGPADQVSVRPEINGRIVELPIDIGDKVNKGALLCRLDDKDLQIERSQRLTEIDGARLQLQRATRNFARSKQLFADRLVSQEVFDDSKTEYDLATNSIDRAQQALNLVEDRLSKTKIMAPFDCTVLTRPVSLGQTLSGAAGFNSGTEVMSIANLTDMIISAHINQADVTRLVTGQDVDIQIESVASLHMKGVLERIAPQAVIKNGIKGFAARVLIKNIDPRIRPGMTAILNIPISSAENVLAVPLAAVFTEKGERFVFVKLEEQFERRPVVIGVTDFSYAEVQKGLTQGEIVSLEQTIDSSALKAGSSVVPAKKSPREGSAGNIPSPGTSPPPGGARPEKPGGSRAAGKAVGS